METSEEATGNIMPALEAKVRRIGGVTYRVLIEVRFERKQVLTLRWIILYSRKGGEKT